MKAGRDCLDMSGAEEGSSRVGGCGWQEVWRRRREGMCECGEDCPYKTFIAAALLSFLSDCDQPPTAAASVSFCLLILDFIP